MRAVRKLSLLASVFVLGSVFGPLGLAAWGGLSAPADAFEHGRTASRLLQAFDEHSAVPRPLAKFDWSILARNCGYDVEKLFENDEEGRLEIDAPWTPSGGYFDLLLWYAEISEIVTGRLRAEQLGRSLSPFEASFLNACLRRTVFGSFCADRVRRRLDAAGLLNPYHLPSDTETPEGQRRLRTVCMYLDGAAARAGQTLSPVGR